MTSTHGQNATNRQAVKNILHIENSGAEHIAVRKILQRFMPDALLIPAATLKEAEFVLADGERIDLILLDLNMRDAFDRQGAFMRIERFSKNIPVVVLTGITDHEMVIGLVNSGADNFVRKSVIETCPEILRDAIDIALCHYTRNRRTLGEKDQIISWMSGNYSVQR